MHRPVITVVPSTAYPTCFPLTQFTCNNGRCININWRCDNGECLFSASSPSVPVLHLSFMYQCAVHVSPPSLHWHTLPFVNSCVCVFPLFSLLFSFCVFGFVVLCCCCYYFFYFYFFSSVLYGLPTLLSSVGSVFQKRIVLTALMS